MNKRGPAIKGTSTDGMFTFKLNLTKISLS